MGGGSSKPKPDLRAAASAMIAKRDAERNAIRNKLDQDISLLKEQIEDTKNKIDMKKLEVGKKRTEYNKISRILANLTNEKNTKYSNKINLENYKSQLQTYQKKLKYSIRLLETELAGLKQFINLQLRNKLYYDTEYDKIFNKVIVRNQLRHKGYTHRNSVLDRNVNQMEQKYSNIHNDSYYQNIHNEYFMTINAIFWWIYYLLFIVICYQIVYIQTELALSTKIIWLTVLLLFPLLYYVYDLALMKI